MVEDMYHGQADKPAADVLAELFSQIFHLRGALERRGNEMTRGVGQTCSRWQVLSAARQQSRTVPEIARRMGLTRQAVQRLADQMEDEKLVIDAGNPAHARSPLLRLTPKWETTLQQIDTRQVRWNRRLVNGIAPRDLNGALRTLRTLASRVERIAPTPLPERLSPARRYRGRDRVRDR